MLLKLRLRCLIMLLCSNSADMAAAWQNWTEFCLDFSFFVGLVDFKDN